jgi:hypothetical protein
MMNNEISESAVKVWKKFCDKLGVEIIAPYTLETQGHLINCLAFLPNFGGPRGMIVGSMNLPEVTTDPQLIKIAQEKGLFYSFINTKAFTTTEIDETIFKATLADWGYYGPLKRRPRWLIESDHKQQHGERGGE